MPKGGPVLHRLANREDASRGALRATSATGTHQPVQPQAFHRRSLPARPARRLRAQRRPMRRASQRCCFKQRVLRALLGRKFLRTRTVSADAAHPFAWLAAHFILLHPNFPPHTSCCCSAGCRRRSHLGMRDRTRACCTVTASLTAYEMRSSSNSRNVATG